MKVSVCVFSQDIEASVEAFRVAVKNEAKNVCLDCSNHYETGEFEHFSLRFEADHKSEAVAHLDSGAFTHET